MTQANTATVNSDVAQIIRISRWPLACWQTKEVINNNGFDWHSMCFTRCEIIGTQCLVRHRDRHVVRQWFRKKCVHRVPLKREKKKYRTQSNSQNISNIKEEEIHTELELVAPEIRRRRWKAFLLREFQIQNLIFRSNVISSDWRMCFFLFFFGYVDDDWHDTSSAWRWNVSPR